MSGRGRGKRTGTGPGPGRPPKYPNLSATSPKSEEFSSYFPQPSAAAGEASTAMAPLFSMGAAAAALPPAPLSVSNATGGGSGGLLDIMNQLDLGRRNEMLALVTQYRNRVLSLNDFMLRSRDLLGPRLFAQLSRDMGAARGALGVSPGGPGMPMNVAAPPIAGIRPPTMHSMPQIYGNAPMAPPMTAAGQVFLPPPSMYAAVPGMSASSQPAAGGEIDVTKMDTTSLQDVIQYSGVDLKAEAEMLYRDNESAISNVGNYVDHRLKFDYFFNPFKFRAIVQHSLQRHFLSVVNNSVGVSQAASRLSKPLGISEDAVHLLGIAIQRRLISVVRRLIEISKHRVDYGRGRFKIKIENDPKKQLWLQEKLFIEGVGEEQRRRKETSSSTNAGSTTSAAAVNQTLQNPPSAKTTATAAGSGPSQSAAATASAAGAAGEDLSVKTKLANVTAMAALGIRQRSWMSDAAAPSGSGDGGGSQSQAQSHQTHQTQSHQTHQAQSAQPQTSQSQTQSQPQPQHPLANFYSLPSSTPLTDAELRAQYLNRTISVVDLITFMESDSHLKYSRLLAILYEALPRENKDNAKVVNERTNE